NQSTYPPCTVKWSLYTGCIRRLVTGRCLMSALSPSTAIVNVAPASSLNQSPLSEARSLGVGVHSRSAAKRVTSPSESTVSADAGFPSLSNVNFNWLSPAVNCPPPIGTTRAPRQRGTPFSITNLAGAWVFSLRQTPTNFFSSSSEIFGGSVFGVSGNGPKISSVMVAATPPALGDVPLHM